MALYGTASVYSVCGRIARGSANCRWISKYKNLCVAFSFYSFTFVFVLARPEVSIIRDAYGFAANAVYFVLDVPFIITIY